MSKYFNGALYHFAYKSKSKRDAQQYVNKMRKSGHRVRVIKQEGYWKVLRDKY